MEFVEKDIYLITDHLEGLINFINVKYNIAAFTAVRLEHNVFNVSGEDKGRVIGKVFLLNTKDIEEVNDIVLDISGSTKENCVIDSWSIIYKPEQDVWEHKLKYRTV